MLQPAIAFFQEGLGIGRRTAITLLSTICGFGTGFIAYFSRDLRALDMLDFWIGTAFIYILATILLILFGWVIGAEQGLKEAKKSSLLHIPNFFIFIIKYVSPTYLLTIFVFWLIERMPSYWQQIEEDEVARYTVSFIIFLLVFFTILIMQAQKRWKHRDS